MLRTHAAGLVVALGLTLAAALSVAAGPAASAAATAVPGACTTSTGVTVIVDFTNVPGGSGIEAGCAHAPSSGYDALRQAGFVITQPSRTPGFICRIDGLPTSDPCVNTPPADAYWSYWYSVGGAPWSYTSVGAWGRTPPPGSVDAWSFSTGTTARPPGISPAAASPPATAAPPPVPSTPATTRAPTGSTGPATTRPGTSTPATTSPTHPSSAPPTTAAGPAPATSPTTAPARAGADAAPNVRARSSVHLTGDTGGSGTPWGVIGGGGGAGLLAAGAGVIAYRRRRHDDEHDPLDEIDWD